MQCNWLPFRIDLGALNAFLQAGAFPTDGIVADEGSFTIVEINPLDEMQRASIQDYLDGLTEEGEALSLSRPARFVNACSALKTQMLSKRYSDLDSLERKLLLALPLSKFEEDECIERYPT